MSPFGFACARNQPSFLQIDSALSVGCVPKTGLYDPPRGCYNGLGAIKRIMSEATSIDQFWQGYLATLPADLPPPPMPQAWSFGDHATLADELADLVLAGTKTATCGALWAYEAGQEPLPQLGELSIVLDGTGRPVCIIETTEVAIQTFDQVDAAFAYDEGEGDRSLAYWRQAHRRYFLRTLPTIDRRFEETMPLVCERFRLVYP